MMTAIQSILLAEDNANDVELTLAALRGNHVANEVVVVRDGAGALDYLYCRNGSRVVRPRIPGSSCWISRCPRWTASKCCVR